jgi:hypothetical protein
MLLAVGLVTMLGADRLLDQTTLNKMEIIGAMGLSLLIVAPIVYVLFYRIVNYGVALLGIETPVPLYVAGIVLLSAIFVSVWSAFEVVERYYS